MVQMTLQQGDLARRFMAYVDTQSRATRATYAAAVRRLMGWLAAQGVGTLDKAAMVAYKEALIAEGLKPASVNLYLAGARVFCGWLESEGVLANNPAQDVKPMKVEAGYKKDYFTAPQMRDILSTIEGAGLEAVRDRAILSLMAVAGLRCVEVARANNGDIATAGGAVVLYVQGKGRADKAEYVKLPAQVERAVREYQRARGSVYNGSQMPLFQSTSNRDKGGRLATRSISRIAKEHFKAAGFDDARHTAHSLRHTAATLNLLAGGSLEETRQLLRHRSLNTTLIYQHAITRATNESEARVAGQIFG